MVRIMVFALTVSEDHYPVYPDYRGHSVNFLSSMFNSSLVFLRLCVSVLNLTCLYDFVFVILSILIILVILLIFLSVGKSGTYPSLNPVDSFNQYHLP
jgi:hypothetical protein